MIDDSIMVDTLYKFFNIPVKKLSVGGFDTSKGVSVPQSNFLSIMFTRIS